MFWHRNNMIGAQSYWDFRISNVKFLSAKKSKQFPNNFSKIPNFENIQSPTSHLEAKNPVFWKQLLLYPVKINYFNSTIQSIEQKYLRNPYDQIVKGKI